MLGEKSSKKVRVKELLLEMMDELKEVYRLNEEIFNLSEERDLHQTNFDTRELEVKGLLEELGESYTREEK